MAVRPGSACILLTLATAAVSLHDRCCDVPRTSYKVTSSFISINGRNKSFSAELYVPQVKGSGAFVSHVPMLVVFAHGFIISSRAYDYIVDALVSHGVAVALPLGVNGNFGHDMAAALTATAQLLRHRLVGPHNGTSVGSVGVGGHSMGGGAATLAMGQNVDLFAAYFSLALQDTVPEAVPFVGRAICRRCVSALPDALKITRPALVFSGSKDVVSPAEANAYRMYAAMPSVTKRYHELEKATHCQFCSSHSFLCKAAEAFELLKRGQLFTPSMPQAQQLGNVTQLLVPFVLGAARAGVLPGVAAGTFQTASSARYLYRSAVAAG